MRRGTFVRQKNSEKLLLLNVVQVQKNSQHSLLFCPTPKRRKERKKNLQQYIFSRFVCAELTLLHP